MEALKHIEFTQFVYALLLVLVGVLLANMVTKAVDRLLHQKFTQHHLLMFRRIIYNVILVLFVVSALNQLGFDLGVLLGAAGILSVALGFASQTSAANLISGLFVLGEKAFEIGDLIRVGNVTGEVLSIDLLSVKIRTFDNLYVRIPNETMIKSEVTTLTKFPIRRIDIPVGVAYKEDIDTVIAVLKDIADKHKLCMEEPEPAVFVKGFGESSIDFQFSFYVEKLNFIKVKNEIFADIKTRFDQEGIEIPFPHRTIYTGAVTDPMPIRMVDNAKSNQTKVKP